MKYVSSHSDRHGKVRYRFRKAGCRPVYLTAKFGTAEFEAEVRAAMLVPADAAKEERRHSKTLKVAADLNGRPVIYFIGGATGPVKIGFSRNVYRRLIKLQVSTATPLRLLAWADGTRASERSMHQRFADAKIRGEWFRRTPDLTSTIRALSNRPMGLDKSEQPNPAKTIT